MRGRREKAQHRWQGDPGEVDGTIDGEASKPLVAPLRRRTRMDDMRSGSKDMRWHGFVVADERGYREAQVCHGVSMVYM